MDEIAKSVTTNGELGEAFRRVVKSLAEEALKYHGEEPKALINEHDRLAYNNTMISALNTALFASGASCQISPPPAGVDATTNADGELIYRCRHSPCHEWALDGSKK